MLRAEESTRPEPGSDQQGKVTPDQARRTAGSAGRLIASCGRQAVNAAERAICGTGAVHRAAVAEGLALSGKRAATLLEDGSAGEPPGTGTVQAAWVHHRMRPGQPGYGGGMTFELSAASAQEAVDHCLVAHRLVARQGWAGLCTADRSILAGPHLVRISDAAQAAAAIDGAAKGDVAGGDGPATVLEAASEAFGQVGSVTGRPLGLVHAHYMKNATIALIATGASCRIAEESAECLREAGLDCGAIGVKLVRPFPVEALRGALGDSRKVVVLLPPADPSEQEQFVAGVRSALDDEQAAGLLTLAVESDGVTGLPAGLAAALELNDERRAKACDRAHDPQEKGRRYVLGAAPAGCWSDQFLLDAAALIGTHGSMRLHCPDSGAPELSSLIVGSERVHGSATEPVNLLFVPEASLLAAGPELLRAVIDGGTVVLGTGVASALELARAVGRTRMQEIDSRGIRLKWIGAAPGGQGPASAEQFRSRMLDGFLAADPAVEELAGHGNLGDASMLQVFDATALNDDSLEPEADFRPRRTLPLMLSEPGDAADDSWRDRLHGFHLTGRDAWSAAEPPPALPLRPAGLSELGSPEWLNRFYPFLILPDGSTCSFSAQAAEIVEDIESAGGSAEVIRDHLPRLVRVASRALAARDEAVPFRVWVDEVCRIFASEFDLSESGATELAAELKRFTTRLPEAAEPIDLDPRTLLRFHADALVRERGARRFAFLEEVAILAVRMEELLQVDDAMAPEGSSPDAIAASLGGGSGIRIDAAALSRNIPTLRGSKRMTPERRRRVESTLVTLRGYRDRAAAEPECVVIHSGLISAEESLPAARMIEHPDGLEAAVGLFDGIAGSMTDVVRAVRTARLEQQGAYDAELHDPVLDRLDWQAFTEDELLVLPAVVAVESGERLRGRSLAAFSSVLRSGRPVQVLVLDRPGAVAAGETFESLAGYHPGLGYLAVAHREALVIQVTLAHPSKLVAGLRRMASAVIPSVSLVSVPTFSMPVPPWLQLAALHFGRGAPLFTYDPAAGATWAERFDLSENPRPELAWTTPDVSCVDESGVERKLAEPFTFAHAAALDPVYRPHFRVIPVEAWSDDQVYVADFLSAAAGERLRMLPYIWVVDEEGVLARAVMTREMAFACHDHKRAWRILQELGGENNEYALRAAEQVREETLQRAAEERAELEASHGRAVEEARRGAAADAMERLVAVLTSDDAIAALSGSSAIPVADPAPGSSATASQPASAEAEPAEAPPAADVEIEDEEDEAVSFNDPYIDAILCTTCNECTNLNGRMFQYNENRQAFVADPAAGTFAELIKAAEKCPARCIHPGAPRDGDDTVTDDLIARAAKFN